MFRRGLVTVGLPDPPSSNMSSNKPSGQISLLSMLNPSLDRNFLQVVNSADSKPTTRRKRAKETKTASSVNSADESGASAKAGPSVPRTSKQQLSILNMLDPSRKDRRQPVESQTDSGGPVEEAVVISGDEPMDVREAEKSEATPAAPAEEQINKESATVSIDDDSPPSTSQRRRKRTNSILRLATNEVNSDSLRAGEPSTKNHEPRPKRPVKSLVTRSSSFSGAEAQRPHNKRRILGSISRTQSSGGPSSMLKGFISAAPSPRSSIASEPPSSDDFPIIIDEIDNEGTSRSAAPLGSQEAPIAIDLSPERPQRKIRIVEDVVSRRRPAHTHLNQTPEAAFPTIDTMHVRGDQSMFPSKDISSPYRAFPSKPDVTHTQLGTLHPQPSTSTTPQDQYHIECIVSHEERLKRLMEFMDGPHKDHPALSRLVSIPFNTPTTSNQETWTEKWKPKRALEVLGNEASAEHLKAWLLALALKVHKQVPPLNSGSHEANTSSNSKSKQRDKATVKRPAVIRTVDKKKRAKRKRIDSDDEDDFIDDGEVYYEDLDEDELEEEDLLTGTRPVADSTLAWTAHHDFSTSLTNTILLTGPSGSGKTAAVYACAEELGWDVFEVYPGIGKRSGANLSALVGDLSKNYTVGKGPGADKGGKQGQKEGKAKMSLASIFAKAKQARSSLNDGTEDEPVAVSPTELSSTSSSFVPDTDAREKSSTGFADSVILLEEVDILYAEDVNFWPAVISLIAESKRPVVMTCNDPRLVPIHEIPLQTTLTFTPCPPDLVSAYLQCIALREGFWFSNKDMLRLYSSSVHTDYAIDIADDLAPASLRYVQGIPDLRRSLNNLQMLCQVHGESQQEGYATTNGRGHADWEVDRLVDWSATRHLGAVLPLDSHDEGGVERSYSDAMSFIDSYVSRRPSMALEAFLTGEQNKASDDELGYWAFTDTIRGEESQWGCTVNNYDELIARESIMMERDYLDKNTHRVAEEDEHVDCAMDPRGLLLDRSAYLSRCYAVLDRLMPLPAAISPSTMSMDYVPWVRYMVARDDELEVASMTDAGQTLRMGGKQTRSTQRQTYTRYVTLEWPGEPRKREALDALAFCQSLDGDNEGES